VGAPAAVRRPKASIRNIDVADTFDQIADLLAIEQANPFRIRAYRNAARLLRGHKREMADLLAEGADLTELPGIGEDLAGKIRELVETGRSSALERLKGEVPAGLTALLHLPGLGPKRVDTLHQELGIASLDDLGRALQKDRVAALPGFGARLAARLKDALAGPAAGPRRYRLAEVTPIVEELSAELATVPGVDKVEVAGSYRRRRDTVGDLDILVTASAARPVIERFVGFARVSTVLAQGPTRAGVVLRNGLQVDLRVVPAASYGAALYYFTGSKAHNIAVRRMAQQAGLKINEYGVYRGTRRIAGETEQSVAQAVGLPLIPPELREDRGEIAAALAGKLPHLVTRGDLKGDLHCHTTASDGHDSLTAMADAARAAGLSYLAVTEHSRRLTVAHGLDADRLARQCDAIDRCNARLDGIVLLKGIEVDILEDGSLDLPDRALARLDLVVAAVHSHFDLPAAQQTERLLKAMEHRHFSILAHPSGRLLGQRPPLNLDMQRVIRAAKARGCCIELNAQPERLDLTDEHCQMAKAEGVLVSIGSDAHSVAEFDLLRFGVDQARRGWLEPADVLNARPLGELRALLRRTM